MRKISVFRIQFYFLKLLKFEKANYCTVIGPGLVRVGKIIQMRVVNFFSEPISEQKTFNFFQKSKGMAKDIKRKWEEKRETGMKMKEIPHGEPTG